VDDPGVGTGNRAGLGFPEGDAALTGAERRSDATWRRHFVFGSVRAVAEELGMSHYACNFYIYVSTSSLFRRQLTRTLADTYAGRALPALRRRPSDRTAAG